jgi:hypothetical protein
MQWRNNMLASTLINETHKGVVVEKMTRKEFIEKYGDVDVKFNSYYKYTFTYEGEIDDIQIFVDYGGNADEIYRLDVDCESIEKVKDIDPYAGIAVKDGKTIFKFYDY